MAGRIGRMDDAALAVAAFAGQVEAELGLLVTGEGHALRDQPFDRGSALRHDRARRGLIAQAGAGHQRIGHMLVMAVMRVEHGGNAALGPVTGAVAQRALGNNDNFAGIREVEGHRQAGETAADNGDIEIHHARDYSRFDQLP